jgi:hypothetical protein
LTCADVIEHVIHRQGSGRLPYFRRRHREAELEDCTLTTADNRCGLPFGSIKVMLVGDHPVMLVAIRQLLEPRLSIVRLSRRVCFKAICF